ncbi:MAG: hypothetical protein FWC58_10935, partial [Desulfobulbus sp.]|nr:hypothetical protein [Desulfobulbus sp.]
MFRRLLILLLLTPFAAMAQMAGSPLQGVWRGTIGTESVVACFNGGQLFGHTGSYYRTTDLKPAGLFIEPTRKEDNRFYCREGQVGGDKARWEISAPVDGIITGTWRNDKTGDVFSINLTYFDGNTDERACERSS